MEESQVTVTDAAPLGFEEVYRCGRPTALVRMVRRIGEFLPRQPDPDGGRLFRRLMIPLDEAPLAAGLGRVRDTASGRRRPGRRERWDLPACSPRASAGYVD